MVGKEQSSRFSEGHMSTGSLFSDHAPRPLADKLRPKSLSDVIGQPHLLNPGGPIGRMVAAQALSSMVLWGPPGCGKTTIARLLADVSDLHFESVSALQTGVADLRKIFEAARDRRFAGQGTLLLCDEVHHFQKNVQDVFLPYLEDGTITLVGATTENPSFELNAALLSRLQVLVLNRLDDAALETLLTRAEESEQRTLPTTQDGRTALRAMADGDGRYLLNMAEALFGMPQEPLLDSSGIAQAVQRRLPLYDKRQEGHYNLISALHKSLRGSDTDAALYWFARMIGGGEDPRYIARRLTRFASEDVGLADPNALVQALAAWDAYERLGSPEGELALVQLVIYLGTAPKSNTAYKAESAAKRAARDTGSLMPPKHILNAPTRLMKEIGYGDGYVYDHDVEDGFSGQHYFPEGMSRQRLYDPSERGFEREIKKRLDYWANLRERRKMNPEEYGRILDSYICPGMLVATREHSESIELFTGDNVDLRHNIWTICTDDPKKKRNPEKNLDFSKVVDAEGVRLSDKSHLHDNLTLKIWLIETLRGQYLRTPSAKHMLSNFNGALWVLRWRNSLSIFNFNDITTPLFEDFCSRLQNGALGLIPFKERLASLCDLIQSGRMKWPILNSSNRIRTDATSIAEWLGLNADAAATNKHYIDSIKSAASQFALELNLENSTDEIVYGEQNGDESTSNYGSIGISTVKRYLTFWRDLYRLSQLGVMPHDKINFDPFISISYEQRSINISRTDGKKTPTLGPLQWLKLLDTAARWVLDYSEPILSICTEVANLERKYAGQDDPMTRKYHTRSLVVELINKRFPPKEGRPTLLPIWYRAGGAQAAGMEGLALNEAVRFLIAACFILVGGLSARRIGELDSLQAGCVTPDPFGQPWLSSYIEKTIRDIDKIPIPAMVGVAVEILENLSASGRKRTGEPWLANIDRPNAEYGRYNERVGYNLHWSPLINDFAKFSGLCETKSGIKWRYSGHQLRRAFAIYYYHGNRFSNLDALSRFLRHFDPEVTRHYIVEASGGRLGALKEQVAAYAKRAEEQKSQPKNHRRHEQKNSQPVARFAQESINSIKSRTKEFEEVRREAENERILDVYDSVETPFGLGAVELYDDIDELVAKARMHFRLVRPEANCSPEDIRETLPQVLNEYVKTHYLEPVSGGFAHCRCRPKNAADLAKAACLKNKRSQTGIDDDVRPITPTQPSKIASASVPWAWPCPKTSA